MRVMTFSTVFPSYHPRKGEETYFVEKITMGLRLLDYPGLVDSWLNFSPSDSIFPKYHTIREGAWWKSGEWFSARVWSGKPYRSKQIEFAQMQVKKVWDFVIDPAGLDYASGKFVYNLNGTPITDTDIIQRIATHDGLGYDDFHEWIVDPVLKSKTKTPKEMQIICWNNQIEYV